MPETCNGFLQYKILHLTLVIVISAHLKKLAAMDISILKQRKYLIPAGIALFLFLLLFMNLCSEGTGTIPTYEVKRSDFLVSLTESGEIAAKKSITIAAPRVRGLKITYLITEGTYVQPGDTVVKFDPTEAITRVQDKQAEMEIAISDRQKLIANQASQLAKMEANLKTAELSYELSKLNLEQMRFEAEAKQEEAKLTHQKNELSYEQTKQEYESQKSIHKSELAKVDVELQQKRNELEEAKRELEALTLVTENEGLVVYGVNWSNQGQKFSVGDQPWPGQVVATLPDLSKMQSRTNVNEVDVSKIKNGLKVLVTLDAFTDTSFVGEIQSVARLGKKKDNVSSIKVFDVYVDIRDTSDVLKPGMTTSNKIIIDEIADTIYVPQEAVFFKDNKNIVYLKNGSGFDEQEVTTGAKSEDYIIISEGVTDGDKVALRDPTIEIDEQDESS